jgi:hypothetical protein
VNLDQRAVTEAWADLRSTRHAPPGAASGDACRRAVYVAALQQAEEYFAAAANASYATSPNQLFYGLSQAGRALAAAAREGDGTLAGHGIKAPDLAAAFTDVPVMQAGGPDSSFVKLSALLGSPPLPGAKGQDLATIGDLWDMVPEAQDRPVRSDRERKPVLLLRPEYLRLEQHPLASATVSGFPRYLAESDDIAAVFKRFMEAYPHAAGFSMHCAYARPDHPRFEVYADGITLLMHWDTGIELASWQQRVAKIETVAARYDDHYVLLPAVVGATRPLHPLMAWWALLFALSMLARYQPAQWRAHIDIDSSAYAVAIESLLGRAVLAVPRLLYSTLSELT